MASVITKGTAEQVAMVEQALDECVRADLEALLPANFTIEFHTPAEFLAKDYNIPGTDQAALGHVAGRNTLWVNSSYARRKPFKARHVIRHEVLHPIIRARTTPGRKALWLPLLRREDGTPITEWAQPYWNRPSEILADGLAAYVADQGSPFDAYGDITDPASALKVLTMPDPTIPDPEPEPEPTPIPDPELLAAQARIAELERAASIASNALDSVKKVEVPR